MGGGKLAKFYKTVFRNLARKRDNTAHTANVFKTRPECEKCAAAEPCAPAECTMAVEQYPAAGFRAAQNWAK
jgi:hypothetical protein